MQTDIEMSGYTGSFFS